MYVFEVCWTSGRGRGQCGEKAGQCLGRGAILSLRQECEVVTLRRECHINLKAGVTSSNLNTGVTS